MFTFFKMTPLGFFTCRFFLSHMISFECATFTISDSFVRTLRSAGKENQYRVAPHFSNPPYRVITRFSFLICLSSLTFLLPFFIWFPVFVFLCPCLIILWKDCLFDFFNFRFHYIKLISLSVEMKISNLGYNYINEWN